MLTTTTDQNTLWRRDVNSLLKTAPPRHSLCKYCLFSSAAILDGPLLPSELTFLPKTTDKHYCIGVSLCAVFVNFTN